MRISENYSKNYFKAEDFDTDGRLLVISHVEMETVGKEQKLVAFFKDEDKALPLNKTNAESIAELYGDESDDWSGHAVLIRQEKTQFENKRVSCMRVVDKRFTFNESTGTYDPVVQAKPQQSTSTSTSTGSSKGSGSGSGSGSSKSKTASADA